MENNQNKVGLPIQSKILGEGVLKQKIIVHTKPEIQSFIKIYDEFRIVKLSDDGAEQNKLNSSKDWYGCQVLLEAGWFYISEIDSTTKQPTTQFFENEEIAREYILYCYEKQKTSLNKLGIKDTNKIIKM